MIPGLQKENRVKSLDGISALELSIGIGIYRSPEDVVIALVALSGHTLSSRSNTKQSRTYSHSSQSMSPCAMSKSGSGLNNERDVKDQGSSYSCSRLVYDASMILVLLCPFLRVKTQKFRVDGSVNCRDVQDARARSMVQGYRSKMPETMALTRIRVQIMSALLLVQRLEFAGSIYLQSTNACTALGLLVELCRLTQKRPTKSTIIVSTTRSAAFLSAPARE